MLLLVQHLLEHRHRTNALDRLLGRLYGFSAARDDDASPRPAIHLHMDGALAHELLLPCERREQLLHLFTDRQPALDQLVGLQLQRLRSLCAELKAALLIELLVRQPQLLSAGRTLMLEHIELGLPLEVTLRAPPRGTAPRMDGRSTQGGAAPVAERATCHTPLTQHARQCCAKRAGNMSQRQGWERWTRGRAARELGRRHR